VAEDIGGFDKFEDGDVYLTTDPYAKTFHVHDANSIRPCDGGYGDPVERDLELIMADIRGGYARSREQLEEQYAAVLDESGTLDANATAEWRGVPAATPG
jgi:N-methylhydantoinase B/oxoprolinase/acetone carboxylase alpha subunit